MKYFKILIASLILSTFYYATTTSYAKNEDILNYYQLYKLSNINFAKDFHDILQIIFSENSKISLSRINYLAYIFFNLFSNFPFEIFLFLNLLVLSYLSFLLCRQKYHFSTFKIFLCLLSLPMSINMHFVWRQYLAQLILIFIIYSGYKSKKFFTLLICLFVHPASFLNLLQKNLITKYEKKNVKLKFFFTIIFILTFYYIGNLIALKGTVLLTNTNENIVNTKTYLYILLYLIYSLPIFINLKSIRLENTNFVIFLPISCAFFINAVDTVTFSRIISLGCFSSMIIGINNKPKLINYYGVISPITYLLYFFFYK